jgi:NAD(P)-dependent dehydrogenase (short-subunit alcohol dehydrogenase family)
VVDDIIGEGGSAIADTSDIATWDGAAQLVGRAIDAFGDLHVVVNNAGITRDATILKLTEQDWDAVIAVHLKGHFALTHHAATWWRDQHKAGHDVIASIVNTTSVSGVTVTYGGQANYGAAKAAIAALTLQTADELGRYGVRCNAIAPSARTRMTLSSPGTADKVAAPVAEGTLDVYDPVHNARVAAVLASEACPLTGEVLHVVGGRVSRLRRWEPVDSIEDPAGWSIDVLPAALAAWSRPTQ